MKKFHVRYRVEKDVLFCRREEGKYKNNVLVCSNRRKGLLFVHSSRLKERVGNAVEAANRAATIAQQKVCFFSLFLKSGTKKFIARAFF